ncbi:inositol polyphosphate multikinase isoform X1 [Ostrinia nubilalis]|uniref:inositol polyphosphate multikinase isoform X1 n=1 Tax=Ostrinia nubilalis TaxID=29057 RepID=UPI0030823E49
MSDEPAKQSRPLRRQRSIYQVHYALPRRTTEDMATPLLTPCGSLALQAFGLQVAGHRKSEDTKFTGLLQCNGTVLKPILKESQKREVEFYTRIKASSDPELVELRSFVPKYYGCRKFTYRGFEQDYIILEDLTQRMLEQCVMDVKIGKRTWDPLASEQKIKSEQSKYAACKQQFGFCIPGYQVHKLSSGKLLKFGKDYGKKLHGRMVREAIRNYLNGIGAPLCRALILQFLTELWKIQKWARRQTSVRLFSTSLLLVYDATRLRECCGETDDTLVSRASCRPPLPRRRRSIHSLHAGGGGGLRGQLSARGPVYKALAAVPLSPMAAAQATFAPPPAIKSSWTEALDKLNTNHSFEHNYEDKLSKIKMNYRAMLDELSSDEPNPHPWGTVKIIDFAHAFFNDEEDECAVDENFRQGIDSFVEIFEDFLKETEDQLS